jgi:NADPH:quinone reductase-like Zn-dependent oxidoreductase
MVIEERPTPKPGAGQIIVTEKAGARQAAAKRLGADLVLDPTEVDVQQVIMA